VCLVCVLCVKSVCKIFMAKDPWRLALGGPRILCKEYSPDAYFVVYVGAIGHKHLQHKHLQLLGQNRSKQKYVR